MDCRLTVTGKNITLAMSLDVLLMLMIPLLVRIFVFGTFLYSFFVIIPSNINFQVRN